MLKRKSLLLFVLTFLMLFLSSVSFKAEAAIDWGTQVYVSSYGQVVDTITFRGKTVQALYAPRNSVSDYDSNSTFCCAAFVSKFYSTCFGIGVNNLDPGCVPNVYSGGGYFYQTSNPVVGDIAANNGHWAIVKNVSGNVITLIEQNSWNTPNDGYLHAAYERKLILPESSYWFFHYSGYVTDHTLPSPVNVGESFCAAIKCYGDNSTFAITNDSSNVSIRKYTGNKNQLWNFTRLSDGSYKIISCLDGNSLDVSGGTSANGTNITTHSHHGGDNQKWIISGTNGSYTITPKCSNHSTMDVSSGVFAEGQNVQTWEPNGSSAQMFSISKHTHNYSSWKITADATCTKSGSKKRTCSGCGNTETQKIAALGHKYKNTVVDATASEKGYTLHKCTVCSYSKKDSYVTLKNGWYYCDSNLPSHIKGSNYTVQYNNYYEKIQKNSPGSSWKNAGVVKNEWNNKGNAYTSAFDLSTSESRVLVSTCYYHYCGPSTGNVANYEQTSSFVHYDSMSSDGVTEQFAEYDKDNGYPVYFIYKNGNKVYCQSGVTCDGSYGSHGQRACAWYKQNTYQDREKTELYKFTKESGWTTKKDTTATKISYRYKINFNTSAKPTGVKATPYQNSIKLTWSKVTGATGYRVYYRTSTKNSWKTVVSATSKLSCVIPELKAGQTYQLAVKAYAKDGSTTVWGKYTAIYSSTLPAVPSTKSVKSTTDTITVKWNSVNGADGYRVYIYKEGKLLTYKTVNSKTFKYTFKNLSKGTVYKVKVRAYKIFDGEKYWGAKKTVETATKTATPKITNITTTSKQAVVNWKDVSGESGYVVYYSTKKDSGYKKYSSVSKNGTKKTVKNLKSGKTYYFKVRSYIKTDSGNVYSSWSSIKKIKVK